MATGPTLPEEDSRAVLQQLALHEVELEAQNTELREAYAALDASRARYLELYDRAPVGYCTLDATGRIAELNLTAAALLGEPRDALLNRKFAEVLLPEDLSPFRAHVHQVHATGEPRSCEVRVQREGTGPTWLQLASTHVASPDGSPRLQVVLSDYSSHHAALSTTQALLERQQALSGSQQQLLARQDELLQREQRLVARVRARERELGLLADHIPGPTSHIDRDLRYLFANAAYEGAFGLANASVVGAHMRAVLGDALFGSIEPEVRRALAGETVTFERLLQPPSSAPRYLRTHFVPDRDDQGEVVAFFEISFDITPLKHTEAALQASLKDKDALLREVHHRVKSNLQVISSLLRLEGARHPDAGTTLAFRDMQGRIHAMALLHESLYRDGTVATVDLGRYLGQIATQAMRAIAPEPGRIDLHTDLAPISASMDLALPLGLLANELITNAFRHGFVGGLGGEVQVSLGLVDGGPKARLRIGDSGIGFPAAQAQPPAGHATLGLQLAHDLARQVGGELKVASLRPAARQPSALRPAGEGAQPAGTEFTLEFDTAARTT
jgi:PAS domain S-box-containing protein